MSATARENSVRMLLCLTFEFLFYQKEKKNSNGFWSTAIDQTGDRRPWAYAVFKLVVCMIYYPTLCVPLFEASETISNRQNKFSSTTVKLISFLFIFLLQKRKQTGVRVRTLDMHAALLLWQ